MSGSDCSLARLLCLDDGRNADCDCVCVCPHAPCVSPSACLALLSLPGRRRSRPGVPPVRPPSPVADARSGSSASAAASPSRSPSWSGTPPSSPGPARPHSARASRGRGRTPSAAWLANQPTHEQSSVQHTSASNKCKCLRITRRPPGDPPAPESNGSGSRGEGGGEGGTPLTPGTHEFDRSNRGPALERGRNDPPGSSPNP